MNEIRETLNVLNKYSMNEIRETLNLLEAKNKETLTQVKLPYARTALAPVMSKSLVDYHYGTLYKGYVDRFNKGEGDATFNEAGAYLHSVFFSQFAGSNQTRTGPNGSILTLIARNYTTFADFKTAFKEEALKLQGSGWVYLSKGGQIKTIHNHSKRTDIAFLVDMWEHSYNLDYHANKEKYLNNIWRIVDWAVINQRL
jgi:Fe-Mn family superoxide dismutase